MVMAPTFRPFAVPTHYMLASGGKRKNTAEESGNALVAGYFFTRGKKAQASGGATNRYRTQTGLPHPSPSTRQFRSQSSHPSAQVPGYPK